MKRLCLPVMSLLLLLAACAQATPVPTPAPTRAAAATTAPSATPVPTKAPTEAPSATPSPTNTPLPTATATAEPTETPPPTETPLPAPTPSPTPAQPTNDVEILLLLSNRYGANYYLNRDNYERFGWHVTTAAMKKSVVACAPGTTSVRAHRLVPDIEDVTEYDVLAIMPASRLRASPFEDLIGSAEAMDLVAGATEAGMPIFAPCSGVRVLAAADVIEGKTVLGEPRFKGEYEAAGATFVEGNPPPLIDGNIVTARRGLYYHLDNGDALSIALESLYPGGRGHGEQQAVSTQTSAVEQEGAAWTRTFGGPSADGGRSVQQTQDGGFVIAGYTYSFGAGESDVYLVKTDAEGNLEWSQAFGGPGWDYGLSVAQMPDGGYAVAGYTTSFGAGSRDVYLVRTDAEGNEVWAKTFGGPGVDVGQDVAVTGDGGLVVVGFTDSVGQGENDVYLIRTDAGGNEMWSRTYGGEGPERGLSVSETTEGGYILAGATGSYGAGNRDVYLIKTDAEGNEAWSETFGFGGRVEAYDWGHEVQETSDGGYIVVGDSNAGGVNQLMNLYLIKTDAEGNEAWSQSLGTGRHYDYGNAVREMPDGGYVAVGATYSRGRNDIYAVRLDTEGNETWSATFGDIRAEWGSAVEVASDGGFVIAGHTDSFGAGSFDVWLVKVDE